MTPIIPERNPKDYPLTAEEAWELGQKEKIFCEALTLVGSWVFSPTQVNYDSLQPDQWSNAEFIHKENFLECYGEVKFRIL